MSEDGNANGWRISGHKTYKQLAVSFPQEFVKKNPTVKFFWEKLEKHLIHSGLAREAWYIQRIWQIFVFNILDITEGFIVSYTISADALFQAAHKRHLQGRVLHVHLLLLCISLPSLTGHFSQLHFHSKHIRSRTSCHHTVLKQTQEVSLIHRIKENKA